MLDFFKQHWQLTLAAILAFVAITQRTSKNHAEETSQELTHQVQVLNEELTKTKTQIVQQDQTDTVITKKPDGTTITETKKTSTKTKDIEKETVNTNVTTDTTTDKKTAVNNMERYSVGVDYAILSRSYNLDIAVRLGNLPLDAVIRSEENFHDVAIGVRYKW